MRQILTFLLCLVAAASAQAFDFSAVATTGQTLYYEKTGDNTVQVVTPGENSWGAYDKPAGSLTIPSTVSHNGKSYTVTELDRMAFSQCNELISVTIPGSVKTIGLRAFANDTALTTATLQEGVERIDMMAFFGCTALTGISLPTTLNRIAASAFEGTAYFNDNANWNSHYTLTLGQWVLMEGNYFTDTVRVVEGIVGIANNAFLNCNKIPKVVLPSTLKYMGESTFRECYSLDTVQLHCTVPPKLAASTFEGLTGITVQVPCGSATAYDTTALWSGLDIVEMPCDTADTTTVTDTVIPINPWPGHPVIGIDSIEGTTVTVTPGTGGVVVNNADGHRLDIYDMTGRHTSHVDRASSTQALPLPASGIYVLMVDGQHPIKLVYWK